MIGVEKVGRTTKITLTLDVHEAEDLAYQLMRIRSWKQTGHLMLEAVLPLVDPQPEPYDPASW